MSRVQALYDRMLAGGYDASTAQRMAESKTGEKLEEKAAVRAVVAPEPKLTHASIFASAVKVAPQVAANLLQEQSGLRVYSLPEFLALEIPPPRPLLEVKPAKAPGASHAAKSKPKKVILTTTDYHGETTTTKIKLGKTEKPPKAPKAAKKGKPTKKK